MNGRLSLDDEGQAALIVVVFALFLIMLIGLVSDGGMILSQRRDLQGLADGAARAAAQPGNQNASRSGSTSIDPTTAEQDAQSYLADAGFEGSSNVLTAGGQVTIQLSESVPLGFAKLLGISRTTLHATSTSSPISGP